METTYHPLTPYEELFFNKLRNYLQCSIYFYGSIQRFDYIPKNSDIDVVIFTENIHSTIYQLTSLLSIKREKIHPFMMKIEEKLISGYKVSKKEPEEYFRCEISIFDKKYKEIVLREHQQKITFPIWLTFSLLLLKIFYYYFGLFTREQFKYLKKYLIDVVYKDTTELISL